MPNRILKESICESEGLAECSLFSVDLYKRLITYADDYGRFNSDTKIMRARLYPREYEEITEEDIINALAELAGVGKLYFYTTKHFNQREKCTGVYGAFPNWSNHQRVRDSKTKCPEPGDTDVNDWYLRRFIPLDMRVEIIERDGFKCKICGKFLTSCREARRFAKLGQGLYHIDHIVPVLQGGRATNENLRLTCPECNLKRKKRFTFKEITEFNNSPRVAENCGEFQQKTAIIQSNPNPIQSESNPNPNARGASARFTPPTVDEVRAYCRERGNSIDPQHFVDYYEANGWVQGKGKPIKDWKATVRTWEGRDKPKKTNGPTYNPPSERDVERFEQERERSRRILAMMKEEES